MKSAIIIDIIGWSGIILWITLSVSFAWNFDGARFQAVGVIGISAAIVYFVMQRHAVSSPYGAVEIDLCRDKRIDLTADMALKAHAKISLLAKDLEREALIAGRTVPPVVAAFSTGPLSELADIIAQDPEKKHNAMVELAVNRQEADKAIEVARRRSEVLQAIVVVLGTLQSGLGDMFVSGPLLNWLGEQ